MNWKGCGRKLLWPHFYYHPCTVWKTWGKPRKISVKVVQAGIQTSVSNVQADIQTSARAVSANIQTSVRTVPADIQTSAQIVLADIQTSVRAVPADIQMRRLPDKSHKYFYLSQTCMHDNFFSTNHKIINILCICGLASTDLIILLLKSNW